MSGPWSGYDDLRIDEYDVSTDWNKVPGRLPPATSDLLVPFEFAPGRRPDRPRLVLPDGWVTEAREELKDGASIRCHFPLFGLDPIIAKCRLMCRGSRKHRPECQVQLIVRTVVRDFVVEMQQRTRLRLELRYGGPGQPRYPITLEDGDGVRRPEVQLILAPSDGSRGDTPVADLSPLG